MNQRNLDVDYLIGLGGVLKATKHGGSLGRLHGIGQYNGSIAGQGGDFRELRPYRYGDDPRQIDWRVSAKKNEPYFRERYQGFSRKLSVVLDWRRSLFFGTKGGLKADLAVECCAIILWSMQYQQQSTRLLVITDEKKHLFDIKGIAHLINVFKHLGELYAVIANQRGVNHQLHWIEEIEEDSVVISDFHNMDDELWRGVSVKKQRFPMTFLAVADYIEHIAFDAPYPYQGGDMSGVVPKLSHTLSDSIFDSALAFNIVLNAFNYSQPFALRLHQIKRILKFYG